MDGYIRGLKREAEQMLSEVEEAKESGRRELNDIDHQIIELVRKKDEQKAKIDKKVKALKDQADAKLEMYNKVTGTTPSHHQIEQASVPALVAAPVKEPFFSEDSESEAEAEEDAAYYPSKAAKKRDIVNSPEHDHERDTPRKASRRDVKSESVAAGPNHSSGFPVNVENYPIIVQHPKDKDTWIQIFCPICKGNMRGDGRWFKGVMGAKRHIRLAHKSISALTTNKVLFGAHEVERLIERRFTRSELDDLRNGRIPAPVARQGTSEVLDESFESKDIIEAYALFPQYPVIIRRPDGEWVELRCPTCNGNCVDGKYFAGVDAFRKHLERDHGHAAPFDEHPAAWVVQQCETRHFNEDELMALLEDREDADPPEKINVGAAGVEEDDDEGADLPREESFEDEVVTKPRSQKRHARSTRDMFGEDSDHLEEHTPKRVKREIVSNVRHNHTTTPSHISRTASSPLSVRTSKDFRRSQYDSPTREDGLSTAQDDRPSTIQDRQVKDIPISTIARHNVGVKAWSDCCPCTLEGHECLNNKCTKAKVCMQLDHSKNCRPGATHTFTPLCMMFTLGSACDAGTCAFSHDEELKKATEDHDCDEH